MKIANMENKLNLDIKTRLSTLESQIQELANRYNEEQCIVKLEELCFSLKCAILDLNLKLPELKTFERYLYKLTAIDSVLYVIGLLRQCFIYTNPTLLFDRPLDPTYDVDMILEKTLSKYSGHNAYLNFDVVNEELNRHNISSLVMAYSSARSKADQYVLKPHDSYMKGLFKISLCVCEKMDIPLLDGFIISQKLQTKLTPPQILKVFDAVAEAGKLNGSIHVKQSFLALFSVSVSVLEEKITWLDTSKSHKPNFATLYLLFKTLGIDMNKYNRRIIANSFITTIGDNITPDQLKSRVGNDSSSLNKMKLLIENCLGSKMNSE